PSRSFPVRHSSPIIDKPVPRYYTPQSPLLPNKPIPQVEIQNNVSTPNISATDSSNNSNQQSGPQPSNIPNKGTAVPKLKKPFLKRRLSPIRLNESSSSLEKSIVKSDSFISNPSPVLKKAKFCESLSKLKLSNSPAKIAEREARNKRYEESIESAIIKIEEFRNSQDKQFTDIRNESKSKETDNLRNFRIPKKFPKVVMEKLPDFIIKFVGDSTAKRVYDQITDIPHNFNVSLLSSENKDIKSVTNFLMADVQTSKILNENTKVVYIVLAGQHDLTRATGKNSCELNPTFNVNNFVKNFYVTELFLRIYPRFKIIWIVPLIVDFKRYCSSFRNKIVSYDMNNVYDKNNFEKSMKLRQYNHEIEHFLISGTCNYLNLQSLNHNMTAFDNDMPRIFASNDNEIKFPTDNITYDGLHLNEYGSNALWAKIENLINTKFSK
ncbi:unnamed protein product, partial [Rotaria socialis]